MKTSDAKFEELIGHLPLEVRYRFKDSLAGRDLKTYLSGLSRLGIEVHEYQLQVILGMFYGLYLVEHPEEPHLPVLKPGDMVALTTPRPVTRPPLTLVDGEDGQ